MTKPQGRHAPVEPVTAKGFALHCGDMVAAAVNASGTQGFNQNHVR